jgi:putative transposase
VQQPRSTQRYEARIDWGERRVRKRLHELARKHPGSGYRRMTRLLKREGMKINKKRVQRLWREEGLRNPRRKRRKRARGHSENSCAMKKAEYKNRVWCWDFTMDETSEGRRLKWFSVVDEFTRECLALEVERRMTARDVVAILTWLEAKLGHLATHMVYLSPGLASSQFQDSLNPAAFLLSSLFLFGIAMCASLEPARRALSVDPIVALQHE